MSKENESNPVQSPVKTDGLHDSVGFSGFTDGNVMSLEENLRILEENGYTVDKTDKGIFVSK